jgi:hypothetical protein
VPEKIAHKLLNFASQIDDNTVAQAIDTATMPFVHPHVALMPDAHSGKGSAVGTVIPTQGAVMVLRRAQFVTHPDRNGGDSSNWERIEAAAGVLRAAGALP